MKLRIAHVSDVGRVRSGNEDSILCYEDGDQEHGQLLVVADGMGGALAGEVASRMAVETVAEVYLAGTNGPLRSLRSAIIEANARIYRESQERPDVRGMGTTCTALAAVRGCVYVAHVGDSRAYRLRGEDLRRLTVDHSVWAEQVREASDRISPAISSGRNQLTRAVGIESSVDVDATESELQPGDRLLLCSDGLWGLVTDPELCTLAHRNPLPEACRQLVALANARGGHDNVSVIVAEAGE